MSTTTSEDSKFGHCLCDTDAHRMSHHWQIGLRVILMGLIVATILLFLFLRPAAYLAALPIPVVYVALALVNFCEQRSRRSELRRTGQTEIADEEIELDAETAGIAMALKIFTALAIGTFILAAAFFDWAIVGIAAAATFLLAILINLPFIFVGISEAEQDEREKLGRQ
ncbi:hypothetical protein Q31b_32240 [Novipirellula aureliae]|uniref:Uncharacterized protein n=1 Tax=Novipirellula aureliae TaxID=2527966 RepID=A0A5C6DT20_9BACT|nr:hypothetical protein [Novipirellula aureliae]TWU39908.1 hypothetical protein Q31b_32240 [Novipirellula aureliae]